MEKRRHARRTIDLPVTFTVKGVAGQHQGTGRDVSLGGMFVETEHVGPFGGAVTIHVELRTATGPLRAFDLPGIIRWVRTGGMGVQFGLLGAHETHAITELTREHDQ